MNKNEYVRPAIEILEFGLSHAILENSGEGTPIDELDP